VRSLRFPVCVSTRVCVSHQLLSFISVDLLAFLCLYVFLSPVGVLFFPTRRSSDLQHLLLTAGQRDALLAPAFGKARKGLVNAFQDRKSTRLNSSHVSISYAVFSLQKKKLKRWERSERDDSMCEWSRRRVHSRSVSV